MNVGYQGMTKGKQISPRQEDWARQAACRGLSHLFFGHYRELEKARKEREEEAKKICVNCPVRRPCLDEALRNREYEVWGGTNENDRLNLKRRRRRSA